MTDDTQPQGAYVPAVVGAFNRRLPIFSRQVRENEPIRIVAIGSSSTAGEGGIVPYPHRLEMLLREKLPEATIDILNRGRGGEEAPIELERFEKDVLSAKPSLVIWQVGTNAVWKGENLDVVAGAISRGVNLLREQSTDVVLMDLQYAPAVITPDKIRKARQMVCAIGDVGGGAGVNVFRRFDFMRRWHVFERISFDRMIDSNDHDRLHQSDWSTQRIARALLDRIAGALDAG